MSLDHLDRLAAAAGFATAVADDDSVETAKTGRAEVEFVPLTRSHWPDAPAPRRQISHATALVVAAPMWTPPAGGVGSSTVQSTWAASAATAKRAVRSVTALVTARTTGRGMPA
jgi:hypothetical protein